MGGVRGRGALLPGEERLVGTSRRVAIDPGRTVGRREQLAQKQSPSAYAGISVTLHCPPSWKAFRET